MTTNNNSITPQGRSTPSFATFNPLKKPTLLKKIDWVFWSYLTAAVSYCVYNLYKAYQFKCHTSFGLDDLLKRVKCQALLDEIKAIEGNGENSDTTQPLLQECESLLNSVSDHSYGRYDKSSLLTRLALCYATYSPDDAYRVTEKLSSYYDLLKVAHLIKKKHPKFASLENLFTRATQAFESFVQNRYKSSSSETLSKISLSDVRQSLWFAETFHSFKNNELKKQSLEKAVSFINSLETPLCKISAWCEIAQSYKKMEDQEGVNRSIQSAKQLFVNHNMLPVDLIHAHLDLANTFFSLGLYTFMDKELAQINTLFEDNKDPLVTMDALYSWTKLIKKISENNEIQSTFKNAAVKPFIKSAFQAVVADSKKDPSSNEKKLTVKGCIEAYCSIASIYQECFNDSIKANKALTRAFEKVKTLPEDNHENCDLKASLLIKLLFFGKTLTPNQETVILQTLEGLYDKCPSDDGRVSFGFQYNKKILGMRIIQFYNKNGLSDASTNFFQKHLLWLTTTDNSSFDKINELIQCADRLYDFDSLSLSDQQVRVLLRMAEDLLPQASSRDKKYAIRILAKAYLQVDRQKALQFLENNENSQARDHLIITAVAVPIMAATAASFFYPNYEHVFQLGLAVMHLLVWWNHP